jgi:hypothetical protein
MLDAALTPPGEHDMKHRSICAQNVHFFVLATALVGCTGTDDSLGASKQPITLAELESRLDSGPTRVEIRLDGNLHATEIQTYPVAALGNDEHVIAPLVAIDPAGSLGLDLGGLVVTFDDATRFRTASESHAARADWTAEVQGLLGQGGVVVRADRPAQTQTQDPASDAFAANDLRTEDEVERKIEMVVDGDNLGPVMDGSSATFTVLGLDLSVDASTRLFASSEVEVEDEHGPEVENEVEDDHGPGHEDEVEDEVEDAPENESEND